MPKRTGRTHRRPAFLSQLTSEQVRHIEEDGHFLYAVTDVLSLLSHESNPIGFWKTLRNHDPALDALIRDVPFPSRDHPGTDESVPVASLEGVLRILQSVSHPRAEPIKRWLAQASVEELEESANPELAVIRARQNYEQQGYPRQWIDQRLRSISGRAEIVGEWYRRGAESSDDFRALTNALLIEAFGMDAETYRQHKGLFGRENLRDYMTDMELSLVSLAETVAATLHRSRGSHSLEQLEADMHDAGRIAAATRTQIESASGKPVITGERKSWPARRNPGEEAAQQTSGRQILYKREKSQPKDS